MLKLVIKFAGMIFVEAAAYAFVARYTVTFDNPALLLFPALFVFFGGVTVLKVLFFLAVTATLYLIAGLALALVYLMLQKVAPKGVALAIALLIPLLALGAIAYSQYMAHNEYFHVGDTPADCAKLGPSEISWCYRNIYREYPTAEVCSQLDYGEAAQCWRYCQQAHNEHCQDASLPPQTNVETTIYQ